MIKSTDMEKGIEKMQHPFMIKFLRKLGTQSNFFNLIKNMYKNHTANIVLNGERPNTFPLKLVTRQRYLLSSLLFNIVLEVLVKARRQKKKLKACILERII